MNPDERIEVFAVTSRDCQRTYTRDTKTLIELLRKYRTAIIDVQLMTVEEFEAIRYEDVLKD